MFHVCDRQRVTSTRFTPSFPRADSWSTALIWSSSGRFHFRMLRLVRTVCKLPPSSLPQVQNCPALNFGPVKITSLPATLSNLKPSSAWASPQPASAALPFATLAAEVKNGARRAFPSFTGLQQIRWQVCCQTPWMVAHRTVQPYIRHQEDKRCARGCGCWTQLNSVQAGVAHITVSTHCLTSRTACPKSEIKRSTHGRVQIDLHSCLPHHE